MSHTVFNILPDEQVLITLHKHWFMLVRDAGGIVLIGACVPVIGSVLLGGLGVVSNHTAILFVFGMAAWLLLVWMMLAIKWTNHYLDMWVVTDRRIVHVEQIRLFAREVNTVSLERVQDATVLYSGFLETVLDFGTIHIQSAGADMHEMFMHGMPQPNDIKQLMLGLVDEFREHHVYARPLEAGWHERE